MRYFFNLSNGRKIFPDPTGREFATLRDARTYALQDARWLLESWMIRSQARWTMEIADENGVIVDIINLSDAAVSEARPLFHALDDLAA
jgi:hypothetical protein